MKTYIREHEEMGEGSDSVWGIPLISRSKGRGGKRRGGRRQAESVGGGKRNKSRKLASCFHSWDIQSNEPSFQGR